MNKRGTEGLTSRAHPDSGLKPEDAENLHALLLDEKSRLEAEVAELNEIIVRKEDCSLADAAQAASVREEAQRAAGIAATRQATLRQIAAALEALRLGDYGVSVVSGRPIGLARLEAVPWASTCTDE